MNYTGSHLGKIPIPKHSLARSTFLERVRVPDFA